MVLTRSKPTVNYKEPSDDEMEDQTTWEAQARPKKKKARTSRSSRAGGGSKYHEMAPAEDPFTPLPLDVVYEVDIRILETYVDFNRYVCDTDTRIADTARPSSSGKNK
ncbi:hypothetical protein FRC00_013134 [Tulasnella sp. 408]|nr:hypothetical protein FRC00_013134 [Tulasnella sp. 408]